MKYSTGALSWAIRPVDNLKVVLYKGHLYFFLYSTTSSAPYSTVYDTSWSVFLDFTFLRDLFILKLAKFSWGVAANPDDSPLLVVLTLIAGNGINLL